jgi:CDP-paratose 2-epimerase
LLEHTNARVHVFDSLSRSGARHNLRWLEQQTSGTGRLEFTLADVRDAAAVNRAVRSATEIYHFAAQVAVTNSLDDPRHDFEVNLGGTFNILEATRTSGRRPFLLFTSTNKVYGGLSGLSGADVGENQPLDFHSPYGCSKGAADQYVRDYARIYGIPTVVFRMSCIAGPRQFGNEDQGWVAHFLYSALDQNRLTIYGDGRQVRDVLHVADLVQAFDRARANVAATAGNVYNIGGGAANAISLLDLIAAIERLTGRRIGYEHAPARAADQPVYVTDFQKFTRHTGWRPELSLSDVLSDLLAWRRQHPEFFQTRPEAALVRGFAEAPQAA